MSGRAWRKPGTASPLLLLDKRTNSGKGRQTTDWERVLTVRWFKEAGMLEFGKARVQRGKAPWIRGHGPKKPEDVERSVRRTRANVRRHCLNMGAAWITTLTYHENMKDRKKTLVDRQNFDRKMSKIYGDKWKWTGVIEKQKRGAWHWHIATAFQVDQAIALQVWREVTGDPTITQVHTGFRPDGKGNAYGKCASYISKYITKDMEQTEELRHRYHVKRGSAVHVERFTIALNAPRNTESMMMLDMACHFLGATEFSMWSAPVPAGAHYGYTVCERRQHQPEMGGT